MAVSKKLRFEVFKRDGFTCQYCGGHPPNKVLEADHILAKSKGGTDDINNLITSCFDCNRGKSDRSLDQVPASLAENTRMIVYASITGMTYSQEKSRPFSSANDITNCTLCAFPVF